MDGTLIQGSSAGLELARELGLVAEFERLESDLATGNLDPPGYAMRAFELWTALDEAHVTAAFEAAPWLSGIREVWADIRRHGDYCAVISLSPDFFVSRLKAWGAHEARSSVFPEPPFSATSPLDLTGILLPETKAIVADELCQRFRVAADDCVAYGDSLGDMHLFAVAGTTVAINADQRLSDQAHFSYQGSDLREAYALVR